MWETQKANANTLVKYFDIYNMKKTLILMLVIFSGCTTSPDISIQNINREANNVEGTVIAEVITNSHRITGLVFQWDELIFWNVDNQETEEKYLLKSLANNVSTQTFAGVLPEGTYRLGLLYGSESDGDSIYTASASVPKAFGTFNVVPGMITNLGTIIYQPFEAKSRTSTALPSYAIARQDNFELMTKINSSLSHLSAKIKTWGAEHYWNINNNQSILSSASRRMSKHGVITNIHRLNNKLVASGKLGRVVFLNEDKEYSLSSNAVFDVEHFKGDKVLIVGENGLATILNTETDVIEPITTFQPDEHILKITKFSHEEAVLTARMSGGYKLYLLDLRTLNIQLLREFKTRYFEIRKDRIGTKSSFGYIFSGAFPHVVTSGNKISIYINGDRHDYNLSNQNWTSADETTFDELDTQLNGVRIGYKNSFWGGLSPATYTLDGGQSWLKLVKEKRKVLERFNSEVTSKMIRFDDGSFLSTGQDSNHIPLLDWKEKKSAPVLISLDNGKSWETVGGLPIGCDQLIPEASKDDSVIFLCESGVALISTDRGRNWHPSNQLDLSFISNISPLLKVIYQ